MNGSLHCNRCGIEVAADKVAMANRCLDKACPLNLRVGKTEMTPAQTCLACGHPLNATTGVGTDASPSEGSITVCLQCGHLMAFGADLVLRELTDAEVIEVAGDPRILAIQKARVAALAKQASPAEAAEDQEEKEKFCKDVAAIVQQASQILKLRDPAIQGAALGELLAMWLHGHHDLRGKTNELREELLRYHIDYVRSLVDLGPLPQENADAALGS